MSKRGLVNFLDIVEAIVVAVVASILILMLIFRTGYVTGGSMQSTLQPDDRYIISDLFYSPKQGDIIVFQPSFEQLSDYSESFRNEGKFFVKRVIALGGQTVKFEKGKVFVDGVALQEDYLDQINQNTFAGVKGTEITVPKGEIFVMGDNRGNSLDSRVIGTVDTRRIVGKVMLRFFPFNNIKYFG